MGTDLHILVQPAPEVPGFEQGADHDLADGEHHRLRELLVALAVQG